ncbi:hypothetical protein Bca4012_093167 [Brassica carinata]
MAEKKSKSLRWLLALQQSRFSGSYELCRSFAVESLWPGYSDGSVVALNHLTDKKQRSTTKGLLAISKNSGGSNKAAAHEEEGNTPFPKRHGVEEDVFTLSGNIPSRRPQKRTLTFQKHLDASHQMFEELPCTQFYKEIYRLSLPPRDVYGEAFRDNAMKTAHSKVIHFTNMDEEAGSIG